MRGLQGRLARSGRAARTQIAVTIALGLVGTALIIAQATLLAHAIAGSFIDGLGAAALSGTLLALAAIAVGRGLVGFGFEFTGRIGAVRVMAGLRRLMLERLLFARPADSGRHSGELAAAGIQGVEALEAYYARYLPQVALAALAPPAILAWVLVRDWQAALILGVTFPLIPVFMVLIGKLAERSTRKRWETLAGLSSRFLDLVSGLPTLRAFGRAEAQSRAVAAASDEHRRETMATLRVAFMSALVLELLAMLGTAVVAATVGVQLASGSIGLEAGLTVLLLAPELYAPLRQAGAQYHASTDGLAAAETIFDAIDAESMTEEGGAGLPAPDPRHVPIALTDVRFGYPAREDSVLDGLSLTINPGETVAVCGASGAGKSTLASLLLRLADPVDGRITCGGIDLRDIDPGDWRRRTAWLPQRPTLFAGTLADNVALHDPTACEAEIFEALAAASAIPVLEQLPDGLATRIGDGGRRLSAGQAQRVSLARAFLRDPSLVVLDEPTAHLDRDTACGVADSIGRLLVGRSALVIAHRPELLAAVAADGKLLELTDGRLSAPDVRSTQEVAA